jgi:hypothetical protein
MHVADSRMMASVGSTIVGSGRLFQADVAGGVEDGSSHVDSFHWDALEDACGGG